MDIQFLFWDLYTHGKIKPRYKLILDDEDINPNKKLLLGNVRLSRKELTDENSAWYCPEQFMKAREKLLKTIRFPTKKFLDCKVAKIISMSPDLDLEYFPVFDEKQTIWLFDRRRDVYFPYLVEYDNDNPYSEE